METIVFKNVQNPRVVKRLMAAVEGGGSFVNGEEVFHLSKAKARKLAYRWRGNRRGRRITAWLERSKLPTGVTIESPVEYLIRHDDIAQAAAARQ